MSIENEFVSLFRAIQEKVYAVAQSKGWWDKPRNDGELIALMHSELSEGLEALRKDLISDHLPEFKGIEEELADVVIRIMDYSEARGLRVAEAIVAKIRFNETRERMHGGKLF